MGYSIYYDRAFIRAGDKYIPLVSCGSSNVTEWAGTHWAHDKNWEVLNWKRRDRVLFSASEILDIARDYELNHQENGMSFKSRNKPFAPGEFEKWIADGMKRAHSIEEHLASGNRLFVIDYPNGMTERWRLQPFTTVEELLDIIEQFNDGREINVSFGNNREIHRPAVLKPQITTLPHPEKEAEAGENPSVLGRIAEARAQSAAAEKPRRGGPLKSRDPEL